MKTDQQIFEEFGLQDTKVQIELFLSDGQLKKALKKYDVRMNLIEYKQITEFGIETGPEKGKAYISLGFGKVIVDEKVLINQFERWQQYLKYLARKSKKRLLK